MDIRGQPVVLSLYNSLYLNTYTQTCLAIGHLRFHGLHENGHICDICMYFIYMSHFFCLYLYKNYTRLEGVCSNLLKKVYLNSKKLDNRTNNIIQYVERQLNNTSVNINLCDKFLTRSYIRDMKKGLKQYFENIFFSFLQSGKNKKLSMYKK